MCYADLQAGLLFFIAVFWAFFPVFTAIFTFPQERAMLNKERAADMYRLSAYFMARTTSDLPLDFCICPSRRERKKDGRLKGGRTGYPKEF